MLLLNIKELGIFLYHESSDFNNIEDGAAKRHLETSHDAICEDNHNQFILISIQTHHHYNTSYLMFLHP